jgi:hypothetical protein
MEISEADLAPSETIGLARLFAIGFRGGDYGAIVTELLARLETDNRDAAALLDLGAILMLNGKRQEGLDCQQDALRLNRLFRQPATGPAERPLRLLMLAVPGDFMANTPVQFLIEGSGVTLDTIYLSPDGKMPDLVPPHDVLLVGIGESDESAPILRGLDETVTRWPRPVLNRPADVLKLAREKLAATLAPGRGLEVPVTVRADRAALKDLAEGKIQPVDILGEGAYPIIARPVGSHAGHGLSRLDAPATVNAYLQTQESEDFSISRFVDYRGADGLFRKFRIAFVGGRPFLCHVAIGRHWMLHYLNAGMAESAAKRAEEAALMAAFDIDFAARHREALADLAALGGLDYFAVDCAETREGRLLVFETDTAMIVHDMDPPDLYPYKAPQMRKIFRAFRELLYARALAASPPDGTIRARTFSETGGELLAAG